MSITVEECLKLPSLRSGRVIAGRKGLSNIVSSVTVLEVVDNMIFDFGKPIKNSDMVLTSFYTIKDDPKAQRDHIEYMYNSGDACIVLYYLGIWIKDIDPSIIEMGNRLNFPIIVMPENRTDFFYNEVIGEVYEAIFRDRTNNNDFIDTIASLVSRLPENRQNIATLMRLISDNLKCTFLLSDASLNNVCLSKWPMSNDITADTISALYENAAATDEYCVETTLNDMPLKVFCVPFSAFEYRNFSLYAADDFGRLTLDDIYRVIELLQIFSKLWDLDSNNILENALVPAIIEGEEEKMYSISEKLGIDIDAINTAIIIRPAFEHGDTREQLQTMRSLIRAVKDCADAFRKEIIIDTYGIYIICFIVYASSIDSDNAYIEEMMDAMDQVTEDYTVAFFPNDDNAKDVRRTYLLYSEYIPHVVEIFPHKKKISYGDLMFAKHCSDMAAEKSEDYRICRNILKPLLEIDASGELLHTLAVYYLDADCEVKKTATLLFVHRNTIQYRLSKVQAITNFRTDDRLESYLMYTAIACWRLNPLFPA